ncbi:uncharacterized protein K452DRAFT_288500 [Aplosporella prunicola CBS 121167]|uniref:Kelch repeat protein n=1 Tax=Aplosporella prunicola CBS 121167 TaxID=1176127 RepID=A0A6A6BAL2_9PEZI|nr:uncharacterized protein K452DRAFT_288500 [Aplosporella prunicola CBS 121167]KAF2141130.1 hypothetical protein K452DRAFT_288500 [Aplosporella prunicola CBS 121167]
MTDFIRRNNHGSAAVGDFVYIDGGLYSSRDSDGAISDPVQNTHTLAIDMRASWTNATVNISRIDKGSSPVFFQPKFWADESANAFYSWSGSTPNGYAVSQKSLWKFSGDGEGGGAWARQTVKDDDSVFKQLTRPVGGYSAVADQTGFFVGGVATKSSDDLNVEGEDAVPVPGVVSYNFSSGEWANKSSDGWTPYGTGMWGQAAAVPFGYQDDGSGGLLVLLGGESGTRTSISNAEGYLDFSSVSIYDVATGAWHSQVTTGEAPSVRDEFCMAGTQGKDSYELFVFGGWTVATGKTHSDSFILSLPAFRWFKGPTDTAPRVGLTCHTVGSGRQVLVIGGQNDNLNSTARWQDPDPWTQGLGIFDMTALEWSDGYDADAADYESPQVVKDWYADEENAEPDWSSDTVKTLFSRTSASASVSSTVSASPSTSTSASSKSHAGAIAGGVVGAVAALVLIGFLLFWCRHRRRSAKFPVMEDHAPVQELTPESRAELQVPTAELQGQNRFIAELHGQNMKAEMPAEDRERKELPGGHEIIAELPGSITPR